jgi:hypothetical protein
MTSAEVPDADALEQQMPLVDVEEAEDTPEELPTEVDPADVIEQHRVLGDDDMDYYPPG